MNTMKNTISGFCPQGATELPEINAVMRRYTYSKTGTELIWLDRDDDNMTFSITFKTVPENDTGVFHIIEHSVLSGSEKYPVKEPFVELLKSSLQTFLNALTFPDKTMYPLSSRNEQDFLNLVSVYMDAVLHPLSVKDPQAFLQEGWHYTVDERTGELAYNGVVYNEMKGAYSSPDTIMDDLLNAAVFPDNCYRYSSGGNPDNIPDLSYEEYRANHAKFYHPSNARIFLDGSLPLDKVLALLDSYLNPYEKSHEIIDIPLQTPVIPEPRTIEYEISPEEDPADKVIFGLGYLGCKYDEQEKILAYGLIEDVLAGSNDSPLVKALLDDGLAEDVSVGTQTGTLQCMPTIIVKNTSEEKLSDVTTKIQETLKHCCETGLDRKQLEASLNRLEFSTREKDFGSYPKGIVFAMSAMDTWLYNGDPAMGFSYNETFKKLREGLDNGYYDALLRETYIENPHKAVITLIPSATLGEKKHENERRKLNAVKAALSAEAFDTLVNQYQSFKARQEAEDTPEALAAIPKLNLNDIPLKRRFFEQERCIVAGIPVMRNLLETGGITYVNLYFKINDIPMEEMPVVSNLAGLIGHLPTGKHDVLELRTLLGLNMGSFDTGVTAVSEMQGNATPYFRVELSVLDAYKPAVPSLLKEILSGTQFSDTKYIFNMLRQSKLGRIEAANNSGSSFGVRRALAHLSAKDALSEQFSGIAQIRHLQALEKEFETVGAGYCEQLSRLAERIFVKERVTAGITGPKDDAFIEALLGALPSNAGIIGAPAEYLPFEKKNEGFIIPSNIGFAATGSVLDISNKDLGHLLAAGQFLTFGYLWSKVRVQGGAYGCSQRTAADGKFSLSSYRDPVPSETFECFSHCGDALRELATSGEDISNYIISAISDTEPYLSPRLLGVNEEACTLSGRTREARTETREALLNTSTVDLQNAALLLDKAFLNRVECVIGSKETVEACASRLDVIEALEQ